MLAKKKIITSALFFCLFSLLMAETKLISNKNNQKITIGENFMEEKETARLQNVMNKLRRGEEIHIATFGGSITTGYASDPITTKSWSALVGDWWKAKAKECGSVVKYMNEGVSGTDSAFGAVRVNDHIINNKVDFVFLEFAMNDQWLDNNIRQRSYEGVIRQIEDNSTSGILALFVNEKNSPQKGQQYEQEPICKYYHIPYVSWKDCAIKEYGASVNWNIWFNGEENVHPNNSGHAKIAEYLINKLDEVWNTLPSKDETIEICTKLPAPMTDSSYQNAVYYTSDNIEPISNNGWKPSSPVHNEWVSHGHAHQGWSTTEEGAEIVFKIQASSINILYAESDGFRDCEAFIINADGVKSKSIVMRCAQSSRKGYLGWACHEVVSGKEIKEYELHIKCPKRRSTDQGKETNFIGIVACR